jgi:hypothetical protein
MLAVGRREPEAESRIHGLRKYYREMGGSGKHEEADAAWSLIERTRAELVQIQTEVRKLEARLYGMRRRKRH